MLLPLTESNSGHALALLREGFPRRSETFWHTALARLSGLAWNKAAEVPIGYLLTSDGPPAGIILTPAMLRRDPSGNLRRVINLSSWYVRPDQRWRALAMLRQVMRAHDAIYTDLTPTPDVARLLPALGFKQINTGRVFDPLAFTAVKAAPGTRLVDLSGLPEGAVPDHERNLLAEHVPLGCLAAGLHDAEGWMPLLFKPRTIQRLPAAKLVYASDRNRVARSLGNIARFLLRRGYLIQVRDNHDCEPKRGLTRRDGGLKFAAYTPADSWFFTNRVDLAGSELCILDF